MLGFKETLSDLQNDTVKVMQCLSRLLMSNSESKVVVEKKIDDYLCELENLCVKSRGVLDGFRMSGEVSEDYIPDKNLAEVTGSIEVTHDGWLHITLNTLLPSCKYRTSNYIGDTISRLIKYYGQDLPYFEDAFLAIVEYCNNENHNALDNDNKGWKMIPNSLKGSVISDDSQFVLSIGLFAKMSDDIRCEIYVMPPEEGSVFMDLLSQNML